MIDHATIIAKYNEIHKDYNNKHIDDYETFVRSRVIEYFFHLLHCPIDELALLVNTTLDQERTSPSESDQEKATVKKAEETVTSTPVQGADRRPGGIMVKKLLIISFPFVAVASLLFIIFHCRK